MRNENILPKEEVPLEIRIQVYKEALQKLNSNKNFYNLSGKALCFLLPCILWDLNFYTDNSPSGEYWCSKAAIKMFPEIKELLSLRGYFGLYTDEERITFLESIINKYNKNHDTTN